MKSRDHTYFQSERKIQNGIKQRNVKDSRNQYKELISNLNKSREKQSINPISSVNLKIKQKKYVDTSLLSASGFNFTNNNNINARLMKKPSLDNNQSKFMIYKILIFN